MADSKKVAKKLPKRTGRRKDRRAKLKVLQKRRKDARLAAQNERAAANRKTRANGGLTPWEQAKANRHKARH